MLLPLFGANVVFAIKAFPFSDLGVAQVAEIH